MPASPRSSTSSDSFTSGRNSPFDAYDSTAALILVPDVEETTPTGAAFDFSSDDDEPEDSDLQLERLRNSPIPPLSSISVFLYLFAPFLKLGALIIPSLDIPLRIAAPALLLFAVLSAFTRHLWYMLARYVRRADLEEIVLETFARGRGKEGRRTALRQVVRLSTQLSRISLAALYLRLSVDMLLTYFPDVLTVPSRLITTIVLVAFIAPLYSARSLGSKGIIYASWVSITAYAAWFACTIYMHTKHIVEPIAYSSSLGKLWDGIPTFAFAFATSSTVPLYASLKGTVEPVTPKPRRSQSFKLLSILSLTLALAFTLPLVFFEASAHVPRQELPSAELKATVAVFGAIALLFSIPSVLITTPALPIPYPIRRATSLPISKVLIYILTPALALLPAHVTRVGSDLVLLLAFLSTYVVPALLHITIHYFRRPLAIVVPPATPSPARVPSAESGSDSRHDELLQRKERTLQRRRLGRRLVWDFGVWVLLVPVGGGGFVWAIGRMLDKW
ncbi:hypothetical protein BD309DRAFT_1000494 [Dichomitus squalens]|uniref:Uncharacterized protein n=1 Tax=Dichomitus squalens TaxID=114155 RepID=A0A4Q9NSW7_9APHY|nr:hypothetical protein BD309DRAFT_1000494 [Dichomitus squalens]TBU59236.1 hypothetical protein BD310DRAFT_925568 [Dichomitus squalens]